MNHRLRQGFAADFEILAAALRLRALIGFRRHFNIAHGVVFGTGAHRVSPVKSWMETALPCGATIIRFQAAYETLRTEKGSLKTHQAAANQKVSILAHLVYLRTPFQAAFLLIQPYCFLRVLPIRCINQQLPIARLQHALVFRLPCQFIAHGLPIIAILSCAFAVCCRPILPHTHCCALFCGVFRVVFQQQPNAAFCGAAVFVVLVFVTPAYCRLSARIQRQGGGKQRIKLPAWAAWKVGALFAGEWFIASWC